MLRYIRSLSRQGPGARPQHDPAGLVHDEAQRDQRDDPDHLARVRAHPPVRAAPTSSPATRRSNDQLCAWLCQATGYAGVSLQPNAGSQGEYAGLLAIRAWHAVARRGAPQHLPDPRIGARHQPGQRADGRHAGGGDEVRRRWATSTWPTCSAKCEQHSANAGRGDDHLPVDLRRVRGAASRSCARSCTATAAASTSTAPT